MFSNWVSTVFYSVFETAFEILFLFSNCSQTIFQLFSNWIPTVLKLLSSVLKLFSNCSQNVLQLFSNYSNGFKIVYKQFWNCLQYFFNFSTDAFKLLSYNFPFFSNFFKSFLYFCSNFKLFSNYFRFSSCFQTVHNAICAQG